MNVKIKKEIENKQILFCTSVINDVNFLVKIINEMIIID